MVNTDPTTPEGHAALRELAARAKGETLEPGWPYGGSGEWPTNVEGMLGGATGEFAGAMSPDVVCTLLDEYEAAIARAERAEATLVRVQKVLQDLEFWGVFPLPASGPAKSLRTALTPEKSQ